MTVRPGAHELGQNHLVDPTVISRITALLSDRPWPIVEWAAGRGALTTELAALGRPVEAVELDPGSVAALRRKVGPHVAVTEGDIMRHAPPSGPHDVVSNLPFHLTTPALRRLLRQSGWRRSVLLTQWEVARKRAAVGGTTLLTAQWWPWYGFELAGRVPATAFRPRPNVDGGILVIDRRSAPLLPPRARGHYQRWVAGVFAARGRGIAAMLAAAGAPRPRIPSALGGLGIARHALPRELNAEQWAGLYRSLGTTPDARRRHAEDGRVTRSPQPPGRGRRRPGPASRSSRGR